MSFNPDLNKQAQEVMYPRKLNNLSHQKNFFNTTSSLCQLAKHLGIFLKSDLNFSCYIKEKMLKAMKGIGIIKKISKTLS